MSYHVFFSFSTSLSKNLRVPKGTKAAIWQDIELAEELLGLKRTPTYTPEGEKPKPGWYWRNTDAAILAKAGLEVDRNAHQWWLLDRQRDAELQRMGDQVQEHNAFVRDLYKKFGQWSKQTPTGKTEVITVRQSIEFWGGLTILDFPRQLWSKEHFSDHMEHLHELLTTGSSRGVCLDCKPFNPKQAEALITLLEGELDQWGYDMRFAIPLDAQLKPYSQLACSQDGGYDWCSECGPIHTDDFRERCRVCPRAKKGKCDLKNSHPAEFEDDED